MQVAQIRIAAASDAWYRGVGRDARLHARRVELFCIRAITDSLYARITDYTTRSRHIVRHNAWIE